MQSILKGLIIVAPTYPNQRRFGFKMCLIKTRHVFQIKYLLGTNKSTGVGRAPKDQPIFSNFL